MRFSCWFDFSASDLVCQARLLAGMVARHKGNSIKVFMVFVEKYSDLAPTLVKTCILMKGLCYNYL